MTDTRYVTITVSEGDKSITVSLESYSEGWPPKTFNELLDSATDQVRDQFVEAGIE